MLITNVDDKTQITQPTDLKQPDAVYDQAQSKQAQNTAIVRAQLEVTLEMGNEPMALLYKTALEAINEVLDPTLETKPIQNSYESNVDVSPEATAKRIVSFATGFYHTFQQQNPDITSDESLNNFMTVIGGGIEKGFKDAREILESLSVLNGKIAEDIDSTYDLVQEGLKKFVDNFNTVNTAETSEG